jgi:Xaa-Pro aminopeptidase
MPNIQGFPSIPDSEFKIRLNNFKEVMSKNCIDLVVMYSNLLDPSAVRYFSDVSPINESAAMLIPLTGEAILCSGQACHEWSRMKSKIPDIRIMPEVGEVSGVEYDLPGQSHFEDLFEELKNNHIKKIGIIGDLIFPYEIYKKLERIFPTAEKISAEKLMYDLRMKKSENELACIRKACEIISDTFKYAVARIKPGVTELDIQADVEGQMLRLGAEAYCLSFSPMIPSGSSNTNLCMNRNSLRKVQESELIDIQSGSLYEGYNAALATPVVLGKIPDDIKTAIKVSYEAKASVAARMKPGMTSRQLYKIYYDILEKKGYRKYSPYGSVHSLGMLECESPWFSATRDVEMVENMVVAIDSYFKGLPFGSFRIEDTYFITKTGSELVTSFNQDFIPRAFSLH